MILATLAFFGLLLWELVRFLFQNLDLMNLYHNEKEMAKVDTSTIKADTSMRVNAPDSLTTDPAEYFRANSPIDQQFVATSTITHRLCVISNII